VRLLHAPGLLGQRGHDGRPPGDSAVTATTRFWGELRMALVGMSGAPRPIPGYATVMDRLDDSGRSRLAARGAVGDVAGHLVRLDGSFVQDEWERRTISIPIETLRRVPRVVGIAAGSNKVETIVAGARTGLLHLLITDEPTARPRWRSSRGCLADELAPPPQVPDPRDDSTRQNGPARRRPCPASLLVELAWSES